jgi:Putative zinc-finger
MTPLEARMEPPARCPDLEELAELLDGTLPAARRAAIVAHLASCEDCYEVFAGAALFQAESRLDAAGAATAGATEAPAPADGDPAAGSTAPASGRPAAVPGAPEIGQPLPFDPDVDSGRSRERPARRARRFPLPARPGWRRSAAAAIAALLLVAAGTLAYRSAFSRKGVSTAELVKPLIGDRAALEAGPSGRRMRGGGGVPAEEVELPLSQQDFQVGVRLVDIGLFLADNSQEQADTALLRMTISLKRMDAPLQREYDELLQHVREGTPPRSLLAKATAIEQSPEMTEFFKDGEVDIAFGSATEACRLYGKAGRADLFRQNLPRKPFDRVLAQHPYPSFLDPAATETVKEIARRLDAMPTGPGARQAAKELSQLCERLLERLDDE